MKNRKLYKSLSFFMASVITVSSINIDALAAENDKTKSLDEYSIENDYTDGTSEDYLDDQYSRLHSDEHTSCNIPGYMYVYNEETGGADLVKIEGYDDTEQLGEEAEEFIPVNGIMHTHLASDPKKESVIEWTLDVEGKLVVKGSGNLCIYTSIDSPWYKYREHIKSAVVELSDMNSLFALFNGCTNLTDVDLSKLDTSYSTNFGYMFADCENLKSVDVTKFDTSKSKSFSCMFYNCEKLEDVDVSGFKTSNATNMFRMFSTCYNVKELDVSGFDTSNVTYIDGMFEFCHHVDKLDVSNFKTSKVTDMGFMFKGCTVEELDVSGFDTSNVTCMVDMFWECSEVEKLDVSGFDTSKVENFGGMFDGCNKLKELDVSNVNTSNSNDMSHMFRDCYLLKKLDLSNFDTSKVIFMSQMFDNCRSLEYLDVSSFNTEKLIYTFDLFAYLECLKELDLSSFSLPLVDTTDCRELEGTRSLVRIHTPRNLVGTFKLHTFGEKDAWFDQNNKIVDCLPSNEKESYIYNRADKVEVTFDPGEGKIINQNECYVTNEDEKTVTRIYPYNIPFVELPACEIKGKIFKGWYTESGEKVTADSILTSDEAITLTARYRDPAPEILPENSPAEYIVEFDANGGKTNVLTMKAKKNEAYGKLPEAVREGYVFAGWYTEKNDGVKITENSIYNIDGNSKLYAHWEYISVAVKQKYNIASYFKKVNGIKKYTVSSNNGGKGKVSKKGILTGRKNGVITITPIVKKGKKLVKAEGITPLTINICKPKFAGKFNATYEGQEIDALNLLQDVPLENKVKWSTPNKKKKVINIDENTGRITALSTGKTKVKAEITNAQEYTVKLTAKVSVKIPCFNTGEKIELKQNQIKEIKIKNIAKDTAITWSTSDESIASIEASKNKAKVTAHNKGTAVITATIDNKKYELLVIVDSPQ